MTMKARLSAAGAAAALLALGSMPAMAQDYSGAFTFGYSSGQIDDGGGFSEDVSAVTLHGRMQVQFPDGFRFGGRLYHLSPRMDDFMSSNDSISITGNELNAGFALPSGAWFGVYSEQIDVTGTISSYPFPVTIGQHYYGIEGGTNIAGVAVKAFYGDGNDTTSYGVSGNYTAGNYAVGGYYTHSDLLDAWSPGIDLDSYGIGGVYSVSQQFAVFAGVGNTSMSMTGMSGSYDIMDYGIGVSYDLSSMVNLPLFASLEYSGAKMSDSGGGDDVTLDGFTLSVTVPMGSGHSMVPDNSVAAAAMNPSHSAISQLVLMTF